MRCICERGTPSRLRKVMTVSMPGPSTRGRLSTSSGSDSGPTPSELRYATWGRNWPCAAEGRGRDVGFDGVKTEEAWEGTWREAWEAAR